jgi:hypothetical protein
MITDFGFTTYKSSTENACVPINTGLIGYFSFITDIGVTLDARVF